LPVRMIVEQVSGSAWAECPNGVESAAITADFFFGEAAGLGAVKACCHSLAGQEGQKQTGGCCTKLHQDHPLLVDRLSALSAAHGGL
ncbi:hypothetical protein JTM35_35410, partial [Pseudomonas aeruginosa]|nr:hypothetical protein [Pseudomonas aeruginosa]